MAGIRSLGGRDIQPGTKTVVALPVTTYLDGNEIRVWVHVVRGRNEGPTLTLLSSQHGGEFISVEYIRQAVLEADPETMSGTLLAIPVANPPAFAAGTRNVEGESDSPDLNRAYPGRHTWLVEQLAHVIAEEVFAVTDALIDYHMGGLADAFASVGYGDDYSDPEVVAKSGAMAVAFGYESVNVGKIVSHFPGPNSAVGYAGEILKVPSMVCEVGGTGFGRAYEQEWIDTNVRGIRNVMKHMGIIPGEPEVPERYLRWRKSVRANPRVGGYLRSCKDAEDLLTEVAAGELLGTMVSPYTFEEIEELRAPVHGLLSYVARSQPLIPGMWAYGLVDLDDPETKWIAR